MWAGCSALAGATGSGCPAVCRRHHGCPVATATADLACCPPCCVQMAKGDKRQEVCTREYTLNLGKRLHGITFKKRAPRAIKEIQKFAAKQMGTKVVRVDVKLNKAVWSQVRARCRGRAVGPDAWGGVTGQARSWVCGAAGAGKRLAQVPAVEEQRQHEHVTVGCGACKLQRVAAWAVVSGCERTVAA